MVVNNKEKLFHIGISPSDGAPLALICGDPGRVRHIAALCESRLPLASNREYTSYSAKIDGKRIIIMSHGIGGPSTAICVEELYMAGVRTIIRIGTCGRTTHRTAPPSPSPTRELLPAIYALHLFFSSLLSA